MSKRPRLIDVYRKWRAQKLHPGERCPLSGIYIECFGELNPNEVPSQRQVTCVRGEPMPPTSKRLKHSRLPAPFWTIWDATNVDEAKA